MQGDDAYRSAEVVATNILDTIHQQSGQITDIDVESTLTTVLTIPIYSGLSRDELRRRVEHRRIVMVSAPFLLEDTTDHQPWLRERKSAIKWRFWSRYRRYLLEGLPKMERHAWSIPAIAALDETTDLVLERLEDPSDPGRQFDRRGMVVGRVQSGKTANFTGLICKGVDAGYKVIVVLAGPYDNLRSQTQMRLDEELIGYDTAQFTRASQVAENAAQGRIGVGDPQILPGEDWLGSQSLTNRTPDGDFRMAVASAMVADLGTIPTLLVVKKNASVLRNLVTYFRESPRAQMDPGTGHTVLHDIPLLVIDDECDYASVNTKKATDEEGKHLDDYNPTAINRRIRELLTTFSQRAYIGYTATPFANIFIYSEGKHRVYGADLFPKSFILALPVPSDYIGPEQVFGTGEGQGRYRRLVTTITDHKGFLADDHDKEAPVGPLPGTLKEAIRSFILAAAIRRVRGQKTVHNSLLIHVTRFQDVQQRVFDRVEEELKDIKAELTYGKNSAGSSLRSELRRVWEEKFAPVSRDLGRLVTGETWEAIDAELVPAVDKTKMKLINGSSTDILDYHDRRKEGINVIVVGGDKLSRGLTLEGLTVSYFLRASRMYDTLMQMGRWFGYRPAYEDVCRIYTTDELKRWYADIASASEELLKEFQAMVDEGATPETYGLRVKSHPDLLITSQVKMREGETLLISHEGTIRESTVFHVARELLRRNLDLTEGFLRTLGPPSRQGSESGWRWDRVDGGRVADLLEGIQTHPRALRANGRRLAEYVRSQLVEGELKEWTVLLASRPASGSSGGEEEQSEIAHGSDRDPIVSREIGGLKVNLTHRKPRSNVPGSHITIGRLVSPSHERIDLTPDELLQARERTVRNRVESGKPAPEGDIATVEPSGRAVRLSRPKERGLLLLYPLDPTCIEMRIREGVKDEPDVITPDPDFRLELPLIGFAVSFPGSKTARKVEYKVNNVYWEQEYGTA